MVAKGDTSGRDTTEARKMLAALRKAQALHFEAPGSRCLRVQARADLEGRRGMISDGADVPNARSGTLRFTETIPST